MKVAHFAVAFATAFSISASAQAGEVNVAVAANFTEPAKEIAKLFEAATGHKAVLSFGATGQLYAQITQDAPFGVFLSADDTTPKKAAAEGFAVQGSTFTYAIGTLVLWTKDAKRPVGDAALREAKFDKIAIANPKAAPYGAAAVAAMTKMGVYEALTPKLVQGANIAQTLQFADTGAAEYAFVALSQVIKKGDGAYWVVPAALHEPIRQDAALLKKAANDAVAKAFYNFLKSPEALKVIESFGYGVAAK
ncbi:MAG TPA: molybdate ABC transporter substrate-binding protein [Azospirillaceae bacterium]|nr:molybdate ABC transporter substrate-binding protein [Azospirillaceae bacterium]HRQ82205.1 molybdate ABC transporter substrate-binding protein [Azospirillaceae bacterium]